MATGPLTFGSLFAGIGGLDLGLERAGLWCRWQVESDPWRRQVLGKHWPGIWKGHDVRTLLRDLPEDLRDVDVVVGGFPCKQTSTIAAVHGRREGLRGVDSSLWYDMLAVVEGLRPRYAIVENVAGALSWAPEITGGLEAAGYGVSECHASAWDSGAPHIRRRVFFIADRDGPGLEIAGASRSSQAERDARRAAHRDDWLAALPGVLRVDDGLPGGLDRNRRIEAVGNAVVPQVAESIGRRLIVHHRTTVSLES